MTNRNWIVIGIQGALLFVGMAGLSLLYTGCGSGCKTALDCPSSQVCLLNTDGKTRSCQNKPDGTAEEKPTDQGGTDAGTDAGGSDKTNGPEPNGPEGSEPNRDGIVQDGADGGTVEQKPELPPGPQLGELVINEVLFDPAADTAGDANKDGTRSSSDDEFVEIVNVSKNAVNLTGVVIDIGGKTFAFPEGTVLPGETAVVVFGGGMKDDKEVNTGQPHSQFGGALVFNQLPSSLLNDSAKIVLKTADGTELGSFSYGTTDCPGGGSTDQSVTLSPDVTGKCTLHTQAANSQTSLFSPGTRADGSKFSDPLPEPPPVEVPGEASGETPMLDGGTEVTTEVTPEQPVEQPVEQSPTETIPEPPAGVKPVVGDLVINELHTDPDTTNGDANKDGSSSTSTDEFIEIVNGSSKTLNMTGVEVYIDTGSAVKVFTFAGLSLGPNEVVVLFSGGTPPGNVDNGQPNTTFGCAGKNVYVYLYQSGKSLNNGGGKVYLRNAGDTTDLASFTYGVTGCEGDQNQSVTLSPDLTGSCKLHSQADPNKSLFSPGRKADGTCF